MMPRNLDEDDRLNANARSVLISLAARADKKRECWPSQDTLARDAKVSPSTVKRVIPLLVECGYISTRRREGKSLVYRMEFDHRGKQEKGTVENPSTVAERDTDLGHSDLPPRSHRPTTQVTQTYHLGHSDLLSRDKEVDKGSIEREVEPPMSPTGGEDAKPKRKRHEYTSEFETFWSIYPRKDDKRRALTAFNNALERATLEQLCAGAERYANDPNREPQYTKHAATWLNGDCWLNPPLPARRVSDPWGDRVRSVLAAGQTQPPPPNIGYGYPPRLISGGDYDDL